MAWYLTFYVMSRKMVLVPESLLIELKGKLPKSPEFQATLGLGHELDHIQDREDLNPEEKAGLYGQQLARYRHYLEKARNEGKTVSLPPATPTTPTGEVKAPSGEVKAPQASAEANELDAQVIQSVGKNMKKKASLLLDHLKKSKVVKWNAQGQVSYQGREIPHSNIIDLVSDTMRQKTRKHHPQLAGMVEFAQALKESNTPNEYVQNPDVIKAMQKPGKISTPKWLGDGDDDLDDTGFQDASSLTPIRTSLETPIGKQRKKDYYKGFTPMRKGFHTGSIKGWQTLRK